MSKKRKIHAASFKAKVALAAVKEVQTASQLASIHGVHPVTIHQWKKQLLQGAESLFVTGSSVRQAQAEEKNSSSELYEQIGRLQMELDWIKKKGE